MAIALSAYAAHAAVAPLQQRWLLQSALFAFVHGVALAALARQTPRWLGRVALGMMLLGVLLFCGSLTAGAVLDTSTRLAPTGGSLMILAWLLFAADALRR